MAKKLTIDDMLTMPNIADALDKDKTQEIGRDALQGMTHDLGSRAQWATRNNRGMNLAMQLSKEKNFPWPKCSNIMFPLITVAALQYHARAYPALISGTDVFQARVIGPDPTGEKTAQAERISEHMSWQALEQDDGWEEEMDKALLIQPITGCVFKKTTFDVARQMLTSQAVSPRDLIISYYTKNLDTSPRYTHRFFYDENVIRQKVIDGQFTDFEKTDEPRPLPVTMLSEGVEAEDDKDLREGREKPPMDDTSAYWVGEQYCWLDLDDDGFKEPYITTFDLSTGKVWRIVARYDRKDVKRHKKEVFDIRPIRVFTKYPFIPSPDGGIYDLGLGSLAGPVNRSVNTIINQLVDAGTMSTLGGGFLGRGFKGRGGPFTMKPYEWHHLDGYGDDIRKSVMPNPVKEPSNVLFQLLGFLVEYGERIVSSTEIQVGSSPGQNQKATTTQILNENGQRIYTGVYKRVWRAMKHEAGVRHDNNMRFLSVDKDYEEIAHGRGAIIQADDYTKASVFVRPAADPMVVSSEQRQAQAGMILQNAMQLPGHNRYKATVRFYKTMNIPGYEDFLMPPGKDPQTGQPLPDWPPPQDPKMMQAQAAMMKAQTAAQDSQEANLKARIMLQREIEESFARVTELYAKASLETAQAEGARMDPPIKMLYAQIEAEGKHRDALLKALDTLVKIKGSTAEADTNEGTTQTGSASGVGAGSQAKSNGAGMGGMEAQQPNQAVPAGGNGVGAGDTGQLG